MRTPSLIAAMLTLALAAPAVTVATASPGPDPIAHAAASPVPDPIAHAAATQHASSGDPYVDPFGHHHGHRPGDPYIDPVGAGTPTPLPAHALGKACADESHKHVAGTPGTPFSECVHALKALHDGTRHTAAGACRVESHKHVRGQKGTPFSRCVAAARTLTHSKRAHRVLATGPR